MRDSPVVAGQIRLFQKNEGGCLDQERGSRKKVYLTVSLCKTTAWFLEDEEEEEEVVLVMDPSSPNCTSQPEVAKREGGFLKPHWCPLERERERESGKTGQKDIGCLAASGGEEEYSW